MKEFRIAQATKKLLAVACEPVAEILAVDVSAFPHVRLLLPRPLAVCLRILWAH